MQTRIVISGLPASGKTTLAVALAASLRFALLDKDTFLEALFQSEGIGPLEWRRRLSQEADAKFRRAASATQRAVLTSWWKHPRSGIDSGTPIEWLELAPALLEVHCVCSASVAAARFLARSRHPGHLDAQRSTTVLLAMLAAQADFGPLFPTRAITVNTERPVDLPVLTHAVQSALHANAVPHSTL